MDKVAQHNTLCNMFGKNAVNQIGLFDTTINFFYPNDNNKTYYTYTFELNMGAGGIDNQFKLL